MGPAIAALALTIPLFVAVGLQPVVGPFNRLLSLRPFAAAYNGASEGSAAPGLAYGKIQPGFILFTGRRFELLTSAERLEQALQAHLEYRELARVSYRHSAVLVIASDSVKGRSGNL